jgi:shikimate kinase/3-dehydroquinate synthase
VIFLIGFMGAGKTTVGRRLAERLGLPFRDADRALEERAGASIAAIFETEGEPAFRALERTVVAELTRGPTGVIALGGGALEDPATLESLRAATTVHLDVGYAEAMARLGDGLGRPMLAGGDPKALFVRRRALYRRAAALSVPTDGRTPDAIAESIAAELQVSRAAGSGAGVREERRAPRRSPERGVVLETRRVPVAVPGAAHDVVVGSGIAAGLAEWLPPLEDAEKAFVVTHPSLADLAGDAARALEEAGLEVSWGLVAEGEGSKSLATSGRLLSELAEAELHRTDLVVGFGGGVVTDLAGYVASTYLRGVAVAHVATSLLAQVDAAIGGKTGVNLAQGKNLVGTIHQPAVVVCDVDLLATLPRAELVSGLAEVVKYGLIAEPDLLETIEARAGAIMATEPHALIEIVARSAAIKSRIVAADERERGERAHLNYGHTFAHAFELSRGYGAIRHGEAVALGMMAAAHLACVLGRLPTDVVEAHRRALSAAGLPTSATFEPARLEGAWRLDKKYRRGVRFVLLTELGRPEAGVAAPPAAVHEAITRLGSS